MTLAETVARIEERLGAGALDEAHRMIITCVSEEGSGRAATAGPSSITINAGLAWLFDKLASQHPEAGYAQKALGYGQAALLLNPRDALAYAVLPEDQILLVAHNLLRYRKKQAARIVLERLLDVSGMSRAAHLLELIEFVDGEEDRISAMPVLQAGQTPPLLINAIVWGDAYIEALFTYGFPSLRASGNLPSISKDRKIVFDFYTAAGDRAKIDDHPVAQAIKQFAEIRYNVIPDTLLYAEAEDATRWCAAAAQQCSARRAQHLGADLMFLCGSAVYSAQCLSSAYEYLEQGFQAVACLMPRAREARPYASLTDYADKIGDVIEIDAAALSEFVVGNLHDHCLDSFISAEERLITQNPVTLYFKTDTGFCCRSYQPSPLIISNRLLSNEFEFDYFTIDVRFLAELLGSQSPETLVRVIATPSDNIVITDIDFGNDAGMQRFGDIGLSIETCVGGALLTATRETDLDYYRWAFAQRFKFCGSGSTAHLPHDGLEEAAVGQRIVAIVDQYDAGAQSRIVTYARLPDPE